MATDGTEECCRMCGSTPAFFNDQLEAVYCSSCSAKYWVWHCERCGVRVLSHRVTGHDGPTCSSCLADDLWNTFPESLRAEIDALVLEDKDGAARFALYQTTQIDRRITIPEAQELVAGRYRKLRDRIILRPQRGPDLDGLIAKATELADPIAAFEAEWDGDTQGWFLCIVAIVERPGRHHARYDEEPLGYYHRRNSDMRLFNGTVPPWPEAEEAAADGEGLSARFGVPFHFPGREGPDLDCPRWWDSA